MTFPPVCVKETGMLVSIKFSSSSFFPESCALSASEFIQGDTTAVSQAARESSERLSSDWGGGHGKNGGHFPGSKRGSPVKNLYKYYT